MTRATLRRTRFVCLGVILALFCSVIQSNIAWAEDEDDSGEDDPTIVKENESSSVPAGVQDLGKKERKPIEDPAYAQWWFWVPAAVVAVGWVVLSVWPARQKAPACKSGAYSLGCVGDGR
jgi:hypothetical protein